MQAEYIPFVDELIELCIKEDIGDGDTPPSHVFPQEKRDT